MKRGSNIFWLLARTYSPCHCHLVLARMNIRASKASKKIFCVCIFSLLCLLLVTPKAHSQQVSVTLHAGNIPVNTALKRITAQTGIHFVYEAGLFDEKSPVTVQLQDASLEECLSQIFPGRKVVHTRVGTTVIIQSLADMEKLITGIVRNSKKEAIEAASIVRIGTGDHRGVLSGADGSFRIRVPSATLLEVSCLGMQPYQFRVDSGTHYEITLQESIQSVSEVVVMGMTSVDKRLFTGAADRFPAEDVLLSGVTEVSRSLEGRSAGVVVNNFSGTFGVSPKIRIRGATSLYGNSQPIWVVDGVIIEDVLEINADDLASGNAETILSSAVSGLNPDDIESFRILKDGAATSIYGGRAMAGVIVITTKKGRPGIRQINYSGEFSIRSKPLYGNKSLLNSHSQMEVFNEMVYNGWFSQRQMANETSYGLYGTMYKQYDGVNDEYLRQAAKRNTDWFDVLFSNSLVQQHSVSYSGGSGKSTQYASVSVMDDAGWGMQSKTSRVTAHLNYGHPIRHNLWANLMGTTSHRSQHAPGTLEQETDYQSGVIARSYDINPYQYAMNTSRMLDPDTHYRYRNADFSIVEELSANYMRYKVADFSVQGQLKWEPLPAWELSALGAIRLQNTKTTHQVSSVSNMYRSYWQEEAPDGYDGVYSRNEAKVMSRDFRATANWNQSFAHGHTLHVFTGTEVRAIDRKYAGYTTEWADSGTDPAPDTYYRDVAFFASATYSYNDTYILNTTGRYEGTNRMGSARRARWLPTWNLSGRWNILSNLSTRVSYSLTADTGPNAAELSALSLIYNTSPKPYPELQQDGLLISTLENRDLTYEKKREWNVGLDMGLFQNRIRIGMDYYRRRNF
ncbi:MAG: SusC/RagA family TonB-linked outer membrane protein, partial [Tannerellaceae bacterium]|nr:SusC/RagA family TonB-linked outer membrane protein [Tannerellaceae bacterium]